MRSEAGRERLLVVEFRKACSTHIGGRRWERERGRRARVEDTVGGGLLTAESRMGLDEVSAPVAAPWASVGPVDRITLLRRRCNDNSLHERRVMALRDHDLRCVCQTLVTT
jgi:hypothetical protein